MHLRVHSLSYSTHISYLEDFLCVDLYEVVLLSVGTINVMMKFAINLLGVNECTMSHAWFVACWGSMFVAREDLRECVSHFQLSIEPSLGA